MSKVQVLSSLMAGQFPKLSLRLFRCFPLEADFIEGTPQSNRLTLHNHHIPVIKHPYLVTSDKKMELKESLCGQLDSVVT